MFSRSLFAFAAAAFLFAVPIASAQEAAKIGVCNPGKVFDKMTEKTVIEEKIKNERQRSMGEAAQRKSAIDAMKQALTDLKPESDLYKQKMQDITTKAIEADVWARLKEAEMARAERDMVKSVYEKIREACKEVATTNKLDLVLTERKPDVNGDQLTADQVRQLIGQNDVLYMNDKVDITEQVILLINKKYTTGSAAPIPPKP